MMFAILNNLIALQFCSSPVSDGDINSISRCFMYYFTYGITSLIVVIVFFLFLKYILNPMEKSEDHIKRRILSDNWKNL